MPPVAFEMCQKVENRKTVSIVCLLRAKIAMFVIVRDVTIGLSKLKIVCFIVNANK